MQTTESFTLISGQKTIYAKIQEMISNATHEIILITTHLDAARMASKSDIMEIIQKKRRQGLHVSIIVESPMPFHYDNLNHMMDCIFYADLPSQTRTIVEEKSSTIFSRGIESSELDSIVYTQISELVQNMWFFAQKILESAKPVLVKR